MRLLFVHEVDWARKVRYEIHELPELLSLRGHQVEFIDFPEDRKDFTRPISFDFRTTTQVHKSRTYAESEVRVISPALLFPSPIDRLLATVSFVPTLVRILRNQRYDAIILYSVPTNGWQTVIVARLMGVPVIFRALDASHLIRKTVFRRLVLAAERFVYRRVSWLSANNPVLLEYCRKNGAQPETSSVDYPGLDPNQFRRRVRNRDLQAKLHIRDGEKVLVFLGTLFTFCGLDRVMSDLAQQDARHLNLKVMIIGDGDLQQTLKNQVKSYEIESKVIFLGRIEFEQLGEYLSFADVAMMPFEAEAVAELALPWKVFQYLAAELPVVATPLKGLMSVIPPGGGVAYLDSGENSVRRMYDLACNRDECIRMVGRGTELLNRDFLWESNVVHFENRIYGVVREFRKGRDSS